jgi:hypothetical protein
MTLECGLTEVMNIGGGASTKQATAGCATRHPLIAFAQELANRGKFRKAELSSLP